ncbi:unnamed protein product [Agarophyton chilense]|eukprot:gb/GEZJ01002126.1/.p1 GENE.gb/GEZJ01002126.1/~~gb/GEZJ01002126.1/.p1  ORF type:complete len:700 (-),score=76.07 gb/GEZJ01002126.1/:333-2168(-)
MPFHTKLFARRSRFFIFSVCGLIVVLASSLFYISSTLSALQLRLHSHICRHNDPDDPLCTSHTFPVSAFSVKNPVDHLLADHDPVSHLEAHREETRRAMRHPLLWLEHLKKHHHQAVVQTARTACREFDAGAQTCVFQGMACVNVSSELPFGRPLIYFVDDLATDHETVPNDRWCSLRHLSSDPRYFSSRHWPILNDTVAPQRSCLDARFRTSQSLFTSRFDSYTTSQQLPDLHQMRIKWLPSIWLSDLDYVDNNHNNHLVKDIIWMLDLSLWQQSLHLTSSPADSFPSDVTDPIFESTPPHMYMPQGERDFERQTSRDVNRLNYALILQRNISNLYPNFTQHEMKQTTEEMRKTQPLFDAYPDLLKDEKFVFHRDELNASTHDLVCTPRLTVGAKIGNGAHERVCRSLRQRAHEFYGIKQNEKKRLGHIHYAQPPKRIVILQRHVTRRIGNLEQLHDSLKQAFEDKGVEIEVVTTKELVTAEQYVRVFSRAGVLLTPHGSQSMGQLYMPRHSSLIEIMPVGYTDYAFNLLSESCKIWYYELQSMRHPNKSKEWYEEKCGKLVPHMMNPCTAVKAVDVWVNISSAVRTIKFAMERMGYPMDAWMEYVQSGG